MKVYNNGNKPINKTRSYVCKDKADKANRIMAKLIQRVFPDCQKASLQRYWCVNFDSNDTIIEYLGFKIIVSKYSLRDNYYLFAFIGNWG